MAQAKTTIGKKKFANTFLLVILIAILYFCYLIFEPFIKEIIIAGIFVTIFYPIYLKIVYWTRGKITLSSFIICLLILLVIIVPFTYFIFYLAQQALALYGALSPGINGGITQFFNAELWQELSIVDKEVFDVQKFVVESISSVQGYVIAGATAIVRGTSQFVVSLLIIVFTMFFLFLEGRTLLKRIMHLTPLSNKYDKLIWMKFRDVSYTTIVSTFITALVQAIIGVVGFLIIGLPSLLAGILIFVFSFFPYIGTAFVWLPVSIYLLVIGEVWQGIFLLLWGGIVISLIDNVLRPYLMKDKAKVHPMIIFFSIFGGLFLMGFWGMVFGPLVVALAVTILHIYELEYSKFLER